MSWIQSRVYFDILCLVQIWGDYEGWNEVEYSLECILISSLKYRYEEIKMDEMKLNTA